MSHLNITSQRKKTVAALSAVFIIILINLFLISSGTYVWGGDVGLPIYNFNLVENGLYLWSNIAISGAPVPTLTAIGIIFGMLQSALSFVGGFVNLFSILAWSFAGALGIFLLVRKVTESLGQDISILSSAAAALIFATPYSTAASIAMPIPWVVLSALYLYELNERGREIHIYDAAPFAVSMAFLIGFGGYAFFLENTIFSVILLAGILLLAKRGAEKKDLLIVCTLGFALAVAANFSFIWSTYFVLTSEAAQLVGPASFATILISCCSLNTSSSLLAFAVSSMNQTIIFSGAGKFVYILVALIALAGLYFGYFDKKTSGVLAVLLMIEYVLFVAVTDVINPPFGILFSYLIQVFSFLRALRGSFTVTHFVYVFIISVLFGMGIAFSSRILGRRRRIYYCIIVVAIVASYITLFSIVNEIGSSLVSPIPQHVYTISNIIEGQRGYFAVASLPMALNWQQTTWYLGTNVYSSLIYSHPFYTGGYTTFSSGFYQAPSQGEYYTYVGSRIDAANASEVNISRLLGVFGIRYIIVQGDANQSDHNGAFSFNDIYSSLNDSNDIVLVGKYGNSSLYENKGYEPIVYAANVVDLGNASEAELFGKIGSSGYGLGTAFYTTNELLDSSMGYNTTEGKLFSIGGFGKPVVNATRISPTMFKVTVNDSSSPFYMVFTQTYSNLWSAYYANGETIPQKMHIAVNGFANAWYLNRTGNYTVYIHYTPQNYMWGAWILSFAALFILVGLSAMFVKRRKEAVAGLLSLFG
jgi:hypothetical protein